MSSSSQLFMASEQGTNPNPTTKPLVVSERPHMASEPIGAQAAKSGRGRKPAAKAQSSGAAKKLPQRGLGVAQLERLRLQERWKKMVEMPQMLHPPPPPHQEVPLESVPVQYGAGGYYGGGRLGSGVVMDHGSGGFVEPRSYGVVVGAPDHHHHHQYHQNHDQYDQRFRIDHQTRELSSKPKNSPDNSFDICSFKKKRFNGEINGGVLMRQKCGTQADHQMLQMGNTGLNFYGSNNTENNIINIPNHNLAGDHLTLGFGTTNSKVTRSSSDHHTVHSLDQGVEVMAVHRKGISSANGGIDHHDHVVMEYKFFPGTDSKKIHEQILPTEIGSVSVGQLEASYYTNNVTASTTTSYNFGADTCNALDLSLKL